MNLCLAVFLHSLKHSSTKLSRGLDDMHTSSRKGSELSSSSTFTTRNNGTSMSHASTRGCGSTSNETHHRLVGVTVFLDPVSGILLGLATDLTDHDDTLSLGVIGEALQAVNEVSTVERITTNADASGLTKAHSSGLGDSLVGQGTRARYHSDFSLLVNISRHDTNLALICLNDTRAVRTDQSTLGLLTQSVLDLNHVLLGNTLSNAYNKGDLGLNGVQDRVRGKRRRNVYDCCVRLDTIHGLLHSVENRKSKVSTSTLLGSHSANHLGSVGNSLLGVESTLLAGKTLTDHSCIFVDPNIGILGK
mmetsp:Transcript_4825/g.12161  ORF Transcript_4825/g.12161 Transcript_4825/m.12161 type:complete len:305 (+) Transcript_4825:47-961(+)